MAVETHDRPGVQHVPWAPDSEREALEMVTSCVESWDRGMGADAREMFTRRYQQYRGFRKWRDEWTSAGPRDRDGLVYDAKRQWGAHLHIPLSYRTIEEMVPAAVAHRPRMLYLPRHEQWEHNVQNIRLLIDAQQENIDIDLPFQAVMRSGRIYGLGVGKTFWRKDYEPAREVRQRTFRPGKFYLGKRKFKCVFDDPDFEAVDIFDFMWDPMGGGLLGSNRCRWVVHRLWMGPEQVLDRVQSGAWNTQSAQGLTVEKLQAMGNGQKYDEIWQERLTASGFGSMNMSVRGDQVHEVWEWHDGDRVLTALDRQVLVQEAENGCRGFPFSAYRPTPLQGQMVGIGDLEPLEHLQSELDTLRSQRRDGATLALAAPVVYDSGAIDEEQLVWGPGSAMGLDNVGDVRAAIMRLQVGDVPGSGYEEERVIRSDFDAVSGISAALDPNSGGQISTATEAQLVQAALGRRISLSSRRFEIEVVRQAARQFLALNQRMILEPRAPIRQPGEGLDEYQAAEEGRWKWFPIGPGELRGEFTIIPEGGSMAARNIPQDRQDAQIFFTMAQNNEHVDPRWALLKGLDLMGVRDPEAALKQQAPPVPQSALDMLVQMGFDKRLIEYAVQTAQQQDPQLQQGPTPGQVSQMMGGQQSPDQQADPQQQEQAA
jgi:hypothetical protein